MADANVPTEAPVPQSESLDAPETIQGSNLQRWLDSLQGKTFYEAFLKEQLPGLAGKILDRLKGATKLYKNLEIGKDLPSYLAAQKEEAVTAPLREELANAVRNGNLVAIEALLTVRENEVYPVINELRLNYERSERGLTEPNKSDTEFLRKLQSEAKNVTDARRVLQTNFGARSRDYKGWEDILKVPPIQTPTQAVA